MNPVSITPAFSNESPSCTAAFSSLEGEDDLDVFDHRGGVEVVDVLRPGAAEGEAQGAERPDADAVALLQQGGDTVAYEVHRSLQFGGGHGGVACHGPGDGPGVEAVHGGGDSVPFSGFVSLVRIFFER